MRPPQKDIPPRPRPGSPQQSDRFVSPQQASKDASDDPQRDKVLEEIIVTGDAKALVDRAKDIGKELAGQELKTSQIRGIFGAVRSIEMNWLRAQAKEEKVKAAQRQLTLLKPKLAYQARRIKAVSYLQRELEPAITKVLSQPEGEKRRQSFQNFVDFFEAIIAYHRAEGGAD